MESVVNIPMVDVHGQYLTMKSDIDSAVQNVIDSAAFINGPKVKEFQKNLEEYLQVGHVIPCANGTDALQIALMALDLKPGDEVIVPAFTYVATAEVIALLHLSPKMIDVDPQTFNTNAELIEPHITEKTRAIVPVHLFGQNADMEPIVRLAIKYDLFVVEDAAQSIGSQYTFSDGSASYSGCMGHIGTTSFYPSKNLGCYGDGGAIFTNDANLGKKIRKIANHGQETRYYHDLIGVNSRLDAIQAAILNEKLKRLDTFNSRRRAAAQYYDEKLGALETLDLPRRSANSTHVFHQYTLKIKDGRRNELQQHLKQWGIPSIIYYPVPLYQQRAFKPFTEIEHLENTDVLCREVLSLPMHSELKPETQNYITEKILDFFS